MSNQLPQLTESEFEIMSAVWQHGESTVTEVMNSVNTKTGRSLARSTFQMQILRLQEKGWLTHCKDGNKFYFSATTSREQAEEMIAANVKKTFFGGSCAELVKALFNGEEELSRDELDNLREIIKNIKGRK